VHLIYWQGQRVCDALFNEVCKGFILLPIGLRPPLDQGRGSNFLATNLDWFEANWILESDHTWVPRTIPGSPNQELSILALFFDPNQLIFPPKLVPCRFSLNLPLFGLGPSSIGLGINLKLSTNKIAWIHWSLDLGPSSKVALNHPKAELQVDAWRCCHLSAFFFFTVHI
jgi:hypothetical protein